jgi:hypothetical protein
MGWLGTGIVGLLVAASALACGKASESRIAERHDRLVLGAKLTLEAEVEAPISGHASIPALGSNGMDYLELSS